MLQLDVQEEEESDTCDEGRRHGVRMGSKWRNQLRLSAPKRWDLS